MKRSSVLVAGLVAMGGLVSTGCGGFGGGGGGGVASTTSGTVISPSTSASFIPTAVTRDAQGYSFKSAYVANSAAGGAITAATVAPTGTDMFLGISPLGRVDRIDGNGPASEVSFVFDVSNFAVVGSDVYAATSNPIAARAGQVYSRSQLSGQWALSLDGSLKEAIIAPLGGALFAFQGEDMGREGTVSILQSASAAWMTVAPLGSFVPACACEFNGELFVGGHANTGRNEAAKLLRGVSSFKEEKINFGPGGGQTQSISALCVANNTLFVSVETRDMVTGATQGGQLLYLDSAKGLVSLSNIQNDAVSSMVALDGTIYAGTRAGKLLWLDESGKWNEEKGLPAGVSVTTLVANAGYLFMGVRSSKGAELLKRETGSGTVVITPGSMSVLSITPATGPVAGGTDVTIAGSGFADVNMVTLGGNALTNLIVTPTEIKGKTAAGTAGAVDIKVVSSTKGTATKVGGFTYGTVVPPGLTYAANIVPIMNKAGSSKCTMCHVAGGAAGFAPLDTYARVLAYVMPGNATGSQLYKKIMAPASMAVHATDAERTTIRDWINQGAKQ